MRIVILFLLCVLVFNPSFALGVQDDVDYSQLRAQMVEQQLKARNVVDPKVLSEFATGTASSFAPINPHPTLDRGVRGRDRLGMDRFSNLE